MMVLSGGSFAQQPDNPKKIKVYLLGTFHFAQSVETYNITEPARQESIKELCRLIERQRPDKVFVERQPEYESQNKLNQKFKQYQEDGKIRYHNEVYQVGFRVAHQLGHEQVYQCDHPGQYGRFYAEAQKYARKKKQMAILNAEAIGTVQRFDEIVNEDSIIQNSSLLEYIRWINSDKVMNSSHANYLSTFTQVGSKDYYDYNDDNTLIGAELVADWYRRNIFIYSKMINQLDYTEDGIFLIMGGDHIPILRNLFRDNPLFEVVDPQEWLY